MPRKNYQSRKRFANKSEMYVAAVLIIIIAIALSPTHISPANMGQMGLIFVVAVVGIGSIVLGVLYQRMRRKQDAVLALDQAAVDEMTGQDFEKYVGALLQKQGYKIRYTATTGDFGVDLIAKKDGESLAVQVKRYAKSVKIEAVQQAVAGKKHYGCDRAMVVTNRTFTPAAQRLAASNECLLIDREKLAEWTLDP